MSEYLGEYKAVYKAKTACADILGKAQDGGIVTSMFAYALEAGITRLLVLKQFFLQLEKDVRAECLLCLEAAVNEI